MQRTLVMGICLLAAGCVSKSKYAELEDLSAECDADLGTCDDKVTQLENQLGKYEAMAAKRLAALADLLRDFQPLIDRGILEVTVSDGRVVIAMAAEVLFPSGSAELSGDGKANLKEIAAVLKRRADRDFQVEGHTDNDPISSRAFPSNWYLGADRAVVVVEFLIGAGMKAEQLSAASYGQHNPITSNETAAGQAHNRRIEIVLVPDYTLLPGYQQLEEKKPARRHLKKKSKKGGNKGKAGKRPKAR